MYRRPRLISRLIAGVFISVFGVLLIPYLKPYVEKLHQYTTQKDQEINAKYLAPGLTLYNKGDYPAAESDFRQVIRSSWDGSQATYATYELGLCYLHEGNREEATACFQDAIDRGTGMTTHAGTELPDSPYKGKAETAILWIQHHPDWTQALVKGKSTVVPPKDFPVMVPVPRKPDTIYFTTGNRPWSDAM